MDIIEHRRTLHRIPELDKDLPKTMAYLRKTLEKLNCKVFSPTQGALCAWFDFGRDCSIAFRSDADALPIRENTGLAFSSCHEGKMHACGHDGHMAILLELARRLSKKVRLPHNVLLVFQGAEETTGGAKDICDTGVFETYNTQAIFGLHLWPGLEKGKLYSRVGEMMCRSCQVQVDIYGRSAHIAKAEEGIDALEAGLEFYREARRMERSLPKHILRLLNFGKMESGTVCNAISDHTRLEGSLRAFREDVFDRLVQRLHRLGEKVAASTGTRITVQTSEGYPPVTNPLGLYHQVSCAAAFRQLESPVMTTEDFSWYQKRLPGMFFFLGIGETPALHADNFDFDEAILEKGADFFLDLAEKFQ